MKLEILDHNGVDISTYNSKDWLLAPFPREKLPLFNNDNMATVNRAFYCEDTDFRDCLEAARSAWGDSTKRDISWRLHVFLWAASVSLKGDSPRVFVELGTGRGYMVRALAKSGVGSRMSAYCFDAFTPNLPGTKDESQPDLGSRFSYAQSSEDVDELRASLKLLNESTKRIFTLIQGYLPDELYRHLPVLSPINFLHVDLNHAASERECLKMLSPLLAPGCVILFDDTGSPGSEDQWKVHKEFLTNTGCTILYLPTGQCLGLFGKPLIS